MARINKFGDAKKLAAPAKPLVLVGTCSHCSCEFEADEWEATYTEPNAKAKTPTGTYSMKCPQPGCGRLVSLKVKSE